jgi:hypothetical protein
MLCRRNRKSGSAVYRTRACGFLDCLSGTQRLSTEREREREREREGERKWRGVVVRDTTIEGGKRYFLFEGSQAFSASPSGKGEAFNGSY